MLNSRSGKRAASRARSSWMSTGPGVRNGSSSGQTLRMISMPGSWPVAWMVIMRPPGASAPARGSSTSFTFRSAGCRARKGWAAMTRSYPPTGTPGLGITASSANRWSER